jgi:hypothetical protein
LSFIKVNNFRLTKSFLRSKSFMFSLGIGLVIVSLSVACSEGGFESAGSKLNVVHGSVVEPTDAVNDHTVLLLMREGSACTGTLISRSHILTAAHCVYGAEGVKASFKKYPDTSIPAESWEAHPDYDPVKLINDIAVVKLVHPAPVHYSAVRFSEKSLIKAGAEVIIAGYGLTSKGSQMDGLLRKAITHITRVIYEPGWFSSWRQPNIIMTPFLDVDSPFQPQPGACFGDSGGPLYIDTPNGLTLAGVTSFSINCDGTSGFANTLPYLDWIHGIVDEDLSVARSLVGKPSLSYWTNDTYQSGVYETIAYCLGGSSAQGFSCEGKYCSKLKLYCAGAKDINPWLKRWTDYFSETSDNPKLCDQNEVVTGISCKDKNCGSTRLECAKVRGEILTNCSWSDWISQKQGSLELPPGKFIRGFECRNKFCSEKRAYVCRDQSSWVEDVNTSASAISLTCDSDKGFLSGLACNGQNCDQLLAKCGSDLNVQPRGVGLRFKVIKRSSGANEDNSFVEAICDENHLARSLDCESGSCLGGLLSCKKVNPYFRNSCYWSQAMSFKGSQRLELPMGSYAAGIRCVDETCSAQKLFVCPVH